MTTPGSGTQPLRRRLVAGARGGTAATGLMTSVFAAFDAAGWIGQLPPRQIVDRVLSPRSERAAKIITMTAHFGYGALLGSAFSAASRSPSVLRGTVFGLSVCVATYEGVLPLLRIRRPLHRDNAREIVTLVTAHLTYGATLGWRLRRYSAADR